MGGTPEDAPSEIRTEGPDDGSIDAGTRPQVPELDDLGIVDFVPGDQRVVRAHDDDRLRTVLRAAGELSTLENVSHVRQQQTDNQ